MADLSNFFRLLEPRGVRAAISSATGISEGNLGDWVKGKSKPGADALVLLADYLDCSVDYLLGRTDRPEVNR